MYTAWLKDLRMADLDQVGGKNASLGEMIGGLAAAGILVPGGFATTAQAYREFLAANGLDRRIAERLKSSTRATWRHSRSAGPKSGPGLKQRLFQNRLRML